MNGFSPPRKPLWRWQKVPSDWVCVFCGAPAQGWWDKHGFYCSEHEHHPSLPLDLNGYDGVRWTWYQSWANTWYLRRPVKARRQRRKHEQQEAVLKAIFEGEQ